MIPGGSLQDVDPPKAPTDTISKQSGESFFFLCVQKCSYCPDVHNLSLEVLAFCTKDSAGLTMPLFLVFLVKEGRAIGWNCGVVSASSCCMSDKVKG